MCPYQITQLTAQPCHKEPGETFLSFSVLLLAWPSPGALVQNLICPTCLFKCVYPSTTNIYPYLTGGSLDRSSLVFARENVKFANIWQGTLISIAYMALCHLLSVITLHKFAFRICIRSSRCSKCSNAQFCTMQTREAGWAVPCG